MSQDSDAEDTFAYYWKLFAPPDLRDRLERQFQFEPARDWSADFKVGSVLVEIEGAVWTQGRHTRGGGFTEDCRKYNRATSMGYRVLRYTSGMVTDDPEAMVLEVVNTYLWAARNERTKV